MKIVYYQIVNYYFNESDMKSYECVKSARQGYHVFEEKVVYETEKQVVAESWQGMLYTYDRPGACYFNPQLRHQYLTINTSPTKRSSQGIFYKCYSLEKFNPRKILKFIKKRIEPASRMFEIDLSFINNSIKEEA